MQNKQREEKENKNEPAKRKCAACSDRSSFTSGQRGRAHPAVTIAQQPSPYINNKHYKHIMYMCA